MFLPRPLPRLIPWPAAGERRVRAALGLWLVVVAATVGIGYQVRDYALRHLSAFYTEDMAVLSPARLPAEALRTAVQVAASEAEVRDQIGPSGPGAKLLVYVLPEAWRIPDLPLNTPLSAGTSIDPPWASRSSRLRSCPLPCALHTGAESRS
jgi:hypothetical protein